MRNSNVACARSTAASPSTEREVFKRPSFPLFHMKTLSVTAARVGSSDIFIESFNASSKAVHRPWDLIQTQWGGDHKEKACCDAFVWEQRKSPHYTNLFSLVHSQDTISGLQSFSNSRREEITRGERSQLLLLLLLLSCCFWFVFCFFLTFSIF